MRFAWVIVLGLAGCIESGLDVCGDLVCPPSKVCAPHGGACVDPDQIDACRSLGEDANCTAGSIGDGVCLQEVCKRTEWTASSLLGGNTLATEIGILVQGRELFGQQVVPGGFTIDRLGNLYIAEPTRIRRVDPSGVIITIAGTGTLGFSGDGGLATQATLAHPRGLTVDGLGNLYLADTGNSRVRRVDAGTGIITTVVGTGAVGCSGDGNPAVVAAMSEPEGVTLDGSGRLFVADYSCHEVRVVDPLTGIITTVAGTGTPGFAGDGGPAVSAALAFPLAVTIDEAGTVYIADSGNHRIRAVDPAQGTIRTVAGNGVASFAGDGSSALTASLDSPAGVAVDAVGNLYIADEQNSRIRRVDTTGTISTVAGDGMAVADDAENVAATSTALPNPGGVIVDRHGDLYIAIDYRIRRVDAATGLVATVAGDGTPAPSGDGVAATSARLVPVALAFDDRGSLFIADPGSDRVRRVDLATGIITTLAGKGIRGESGDGGPAAQARISFSFGLVTDAAGNAYIADTGNNRVRRVDATTGVITTVAGTGTAGFSGDGGGATAAELDQPMTVAVDGAGRLYILDGGNDRVRRVDATGVITTVVGTGTAGYSGDGGPATSAQIGCVPTLFFNCGLAVDGLGRLYIADTSNHRVRRVSSNGVISTIAGSTAGFAGDGGLATAAELAAPTGIVVDTHGNLYIADALNQRVRRVDPAGIITTVVGDGSTGDWGPAVTAECGQPVGLAADPSGNLFVAERYRVRRVDVATGMITTVAGEVDPEGMGPLPVAALTDPRAIAMTQGLTVVAGGTSGTVQAIRADTVEAVAGQYPQTMATGALARFRDRSFGTVGGVALDPHGTIYLSESTANHVHAVTMVDPTDKTTWSIAPLNPGPQRFDDPTGLYLDPAANQLYVADTGNHVIRVVDPITSVVSTAAGTIGHFGFGGDGDSATSALLYRPEAVTRCSNGDVFIADTGNNRVRRLGADHTIATVLGDGSLSSAGEGSPARAFPVDTPLGLACDSVGNVFVASRATVRMLRADPTGVVDGTGPVRTIYGLPPHESFPASATRCLSGLAVVDNATVQVTDSCTGILLELKRQSLP